MVTNFSYRLIDEQYIHSNIFQSRYKSSKFKNYKSQVWKKAQLIKEIKIFLKQRIIGMS